jgi:hypothetical protein
MQLLKAAIAAAWIAASGSALAQAYPARTITLMQNSAGGVLEAVTRSILDRVKENTGATLILENRLGAGGALALQATKRAAPDGYSLGLTFASALNLAPLINKELDLHLMTSAWAPKYLPAQLLHYMRTRGRTKIIFASDAPVLSITRTLGEAAKLDLPPEVLDNYLYGNAQRFFFERLAGTAKAQRSA